MEKTLKRAQAQRAADLAWVINDPRGRRFVQRMVDDSGLHAVSPMTGNSHTFYNLGRLDFIQQLLNDARVVSLANVRLMEDESIVRAQEAELDQRGGEETPDSDG